MLVTGDLAAEAGRRGSSGCFRELFGCCAARRQRTAWSSVAVPDVSPGRHSVKQSEKPTSAGEEVSESRRQSRGTRAREQLPPVWRWQRRKEHAPWNTASSLEAAEQRRKEHAPLEQLPPIWRLQRLQVAEGETTLSGGYYNRKLGHTKTRGNTGTTTRKHARRGVEQPPQPARFATSGVSAPSVCRAKRTLPNRNRDFAIGSAFCSSSALLYSTTACCAAL